jgi:hypothetical protein
MDQDHPRSNGVARGPPCQDPRADRRDAPTGVLRGGVERRYSSRTSERSPTFQWRWHCFDFADWVLREGLSDDDWFRAVEHGLEAVPAPKT